MKLLTLGYSALAERVKNISEPDSAGFASVLVVQNPKNSAWEKPNWLSGDEVAELKSEGVAKSRNKVIDLCETKYLAFADDDIEFLTAGLDKAIEFLEANGGIDLLLVQASDQNGNLRKNYPPAQQQLGLMNSARAATYEMIIRVERIRELGIRFDENFGAGVENYLGDEYILIADLLRAGGKGVFLPITTAVHPVESSGSGWGTTRDRIARARVFTRVFGWSAPLVRLAFGIRRLNELGGIANLVRFVLAR